MNSSTLASATDIELLKKQLELQEQLIAAQQQIIQLERELAQQRPQEPDKDVHWNFVSGGITSEETLASLDAALIKQLYEWVFTFGEKYIKPYVHHKAYAEMIAHMMRGLAQRMAELDVMEEFGLLPAGKTPDTKSTNKPTTAKPGKELPSSVEKSTKATRSKKKKDTDTETPKQQPLLD